MGPGGSDRLDRRVVGCMQRGLELRPPGRRRRRNSGSFNRCLCFSGGCGLFRLLIGMCMRCRSLVKFASASSLLPRRFCAFMLMIFSRSRAHSASILKVLMMGSMPDMIVSTSAVPIGSA